MFTKRKLEKVKEINNILRKYNLHIAPPRSKANISNYLDEVKPILYDRISNLFEKAETKIKENSIDEAKKILEDIEKVLKYYKEILR